MKFKRVQHTCLSVQYTNSMNKGTIDYLVTPLMYVCDFYVQSVMCSYSNGLYPLAWVKFALIVVTLGI